MDKEPCHPWPAGTAFELSSDGRALHGEYLLGQQFFLLGTVEFYISHEDYTQPGSPPFGHPAFDNSPIGEATILYYSTLGEDPVYEWEMCYKHPQPVLENDQEVEQWLCQLFPGSSLEQHSALNVYHNFRQQGAFPRAALSSTCSQLLAVRILPYVSLTI